MEVAGFAVGVLALASIFKDCVDLLSMISTARSLQKDAEILDTKLDVEKLIFLQWADRVGLVKPDAYDKRLEDPAIHGAITRILSSIKSLVGDSQPLQKRYGLRRFDSEEDQRLISDGSYGASAGRVARFLEDFDQLGRRKTGFGGRTSGSHSAVDRLRWVVKDREKFVDLVRELSYFNSRLETLVPVSARTCFEMSEQDFLHFHNIPRLQSIVAVTQDRNSSIVDAAKDAILQTRILERLWFRWMEDRKSNIKDAHFKTLQWALDPPEGTMKWDDLVQWLKNDSGIYWICGKAGSGKSTLMKHLRGHKRMAKLLHTWAQGSDLVVGDFFFYHLGKSDQKSMEGVLRALLHQILSSDPKFIEKALPMMWQEARAAEGEARRELTVPSVVEMQKALLELRDTRFVGDTKLFLFIDGLDEYDGRLADATVFLEDLGRSPNVKILASSRPLPEFFAAFSQKPQLHLEDLTRGDIAAYIEDTIELHPYMLKLTSMDPGAATRIATKLADKASGVFLWVVLACRSMLDGFVAFDSIEDLEDRVDDLPPELEDLFKQMLGKIQPRWSDQGIKMLRIVFDNQAREELDTDIPTLALALCFEQGLRADHERPCVLDLPYEMRKVKCEMMEGRLRSRCCGLLEIELSRGGGYSCFCGGDWDSSHDLLVDSFVVFMHRSVYEFLCVPGIWAWDLMRIKDANFQGHAVLQMLWIQAAALEEAELYLSCALAHGSFADEDGCDPSFLTANLSRLQSTVIAMCQQLSYNANFLTSAEMSSAHCITCDEQWKDLSLGLALAIETGMLNVVRLAVEDPDMFYRCVVEPRRSQTANLLPCTTSLRSESHSSKRCRLVSKVSHFQKDNGEVSDTTYEHTILPMLYHATCQPLLRAIGKRKFTQPSPTLVQFLLESGYDPNEYFDLSSSGPLTTPWIEWCRVSGEEDANNHETAMIMTYFLDAGANVGQLSPDS